MQILFNIIIWYAVAIMAVSKLNVKFKDSSSWKKLGSLGKFIGTTIAPFALVVFSTEEYIKNIRKN